MAPKVKSEHTLYMEDLRKQIDDRIAGHRKRFQERFLPKKRVRKS